MPDIGKKPLELWKIEESRYPYHLFASSINEFRKRDFFINNIYKAIERDIPTTATNDTDRIKSIKTNRDIQAAKKIIGDYIRNIDGFYVLFNPQTHEASYFLDISGKLVMFTLDTFKWNIGIKISSPVYNAGGQILKGVSIAEGRNFRNNRPDKYYRSPYIIKQNKLVGNTLKKSAGLALKTFRILGSIPFTMFDMLFFNCESTGGKITSESEFEEKVLIALTGFCENKK